MHARHELHGSEGKKQTLVAGQYIQGQRKKGSGGVMPSVRHKSPGDRTLSQRSLKDFPHIINRIESEWELLLFVLLNLSKGITPGWWKLCGTLVALPAYLMLFDAFLFRLKAQTYLVHFTAF